MKKNIYTGLVLAVCLVVVSAPLFADITPLSETTKVPKVDHKTKHKAQKNVPAISTATSIKEHLEPSELQRQQSEHNK